MRIFTGVLAFLFGLSVGSFINVLVWRFNKKKKWFQGRSVCDHCQRKLNWWENVPLLSFLFLRGRCRTCHSPIPFEYPLMELVTGLIYLLVTWHFSPSGLFLTVCYLITVSLLIAIFVFDLHYRIIPDWAIVSLVVICLIINAFNGVDLISYLISGLSFSFFFLFLYLITRKKGMGFGDVKFSFFMGFFLGWPKIVVSFYLAFLTGAIFGVILILLKKKKFGQQIAFGPFLVGATLISWFWGEKIVNIAIKCLKG